MQPTDINMIYYSGGTTGLPKGVALKHNTGTYNSVMFTDPQIYPYGPDTGIHLNQFK